jgi:hypothetical protein
MDGRRRDLKAKPMNPEKQREWRKPPEGKMGDGYDGKARDPDAVIVLTRGHVRYPESPQPQSQEYSQGDMHTVAPLGRMNICGILDGRPKVFTRSKQVAISDNQHHQATNIDELQS